MNVCYRCGQFISAACPGWRIDVDSVFGTPKSYWEHNRCPKEKQMSEQKYRLKPRNDFVIVRCERVEKVRGVVMPEVSQEGKRYVVEAMGEAVQGLKINDVVRCSGQPGVDFAEIPNYPDRIIIKEKNIILILEPIPDEPTASRGTPSAIMTADAYEEANDDEYRRYSDR